MESNESITNESKTINISDLKSFTIGGLFGYKDIVLPLDKKVLILIAENGAGKTNILNILYQVLNPEPDLINSLNCDSVSIELPHNNYLQMDVSLPNEFNNISNYDLEEIIRDLKTIEELENQDKKTLRQQLQLKKKKKDIDTYDKEIIDILRDFWKKNDNSYKQIRQLKLNILFFPTYRRIEKNLYDFVDENVELPYNTTTLIQFGMEDVKNKFKQIQTEIKNTAFELFSKVTGEMLTQFIEGLNVTTEMRESINIDILNLILSRVGEQNISKTEQEKIKNLVTSGKINDSKYNDLVYFLSKLINLYESQSKIDKTIKSFVNVCNKYLKPNKEIIYNESTAEIYIKQTRNNKTIELNNLSSGEKQIISLFSKVYLEAEDDFILIIDEPELSISVEWQQMLLPDIMRSGKCKRIIAATHSPFIFDNELDYCAYALNQFVTEH